MKKDVEKESILIDLLGNYPLIRVLNFLIENEGFDYTKREIAKHAKVSMNTLLSFWDNLIEAGIIVPTRKIGKSRLYKLNTDNRVVQILIEFDKKLGLLCLEEEAKRQGEVNGND